MIYPFIPMQSIFEYDLFLFDFDGLLVDTEKLHYKAYQKAAEAKGEDLLLSFTDFQRLAHLSSDAWKRALLEKIPFLEESWQTFYQEKKNIYCNLLFKEKIDLMPGVEEFLKALKEKDLPCCVVTHSTSSMVEPIREKSDVLKSIPYWITREDYEKPKPDPECYLKAIEKYAPPEGKVIGFEDSFKGFSALNKTGVTAVLVCSFDHPLLQEHTGGSFLHIPSLEEIHLLNK